METSLPLSPVTINDFTTSEKMYKYLEIREFGNDEAVKRFDVTGKAERQIEKLDRGVNINLNHEKYFTTEAEYTTPQDLK